MEEETAVRPAFGRLALPKVYEAIVREIERLVVDGELRVGDSLPPERELADQFGVSRTAVREAMKVLAEKHLVSIVHGRGVVVCHPSAGTIADSLGLLFRLGKATAVDLTEVRCFLEPEIAGLAASRATPEQVQAIEEIAAAYHTAATQPEKAVSLSMQFHRVLSEAARNEVARAMLDSIQTLLKQSMAVDFYRNGAVSKAMEFHAQICRAMRDKDADAARRHMRAHLDEIMEGFKKTNRSIDGKISLHLPEAVSFADGAGEGLEE